MTDLQKIVDLIDVKLADLERDLGPRPESYSAANRDYWDREKTGLASIADELEGTYGAKIKRHNSWEYAMTIGNVRSTCTSGLRGLFRNWQNAARRRLVEVARS